MVGGRLGLGLGLGLSLCGALACGNAAAQVTPAGATPPPRTASDITGVLGEYRPDPQKAGAAKAAADRQPPAGQSGEALIGFYLERGGAAGRVGRVTQQLEDLRQALSLADKAGADRSRVLQQLVNAESHAGNVLTAIRYAEERVDIDDRRGARGRLFA